MRKHFALATLLAGLGAASAAAQTRAGGEFRVNAYTTGEQTEPAVAVGARGNFVVVWLDYARSPGLFGQRYDRTGARVGAEFQVNSTAYGLSPVVAMRSRDDAFLVVWVQLPGGLRTEIFAQLFDSAARRVGAELQVNAPGGGFKFENSVAADGAGNFVVAWMAPDGSGYGIAARRVSAQGLLLGDELRVNSATTGVQIGTAVAADATGNFVVSWFDSPAGDPSGGVVAQRFSASGARLGAEFVVNSFTTGGQGDPSLAPRPDGGFVAAFLSHAPDHSDVFARRFDASGAAIGTEFQVNTYAVNVYTTSDLIVPHVATDEAGNFVVSWRSNSTDGSGLGVAARRFRADGTPRGGELVVNTYTTGAQDPGDRAAIGVDGVGNFVVTWSGDASPFEDVFAQRFGGLHPFALQVDAVGNQVWEPGETVEVRPRWLNTNGAPQTVGGTLTGLAGPAGPAYTITDGTAVYPTIADGASAACSDCYAVAVTVPGTRPALHWDATALETLIPDAQGQAKKWTLHVGESFADVPSGGAFYRFVETLLHRGITAGCGGAAYCPSATTTRAQMAVFLLTAREGAGYAPRGCVAPALFADVPPGDPFCPWVEELARRGVVAGCGGGNYCPNDAVSRDQMAVFLLRTLDPALDPPACTTPVFGDVPASSAFCRWVEELARRGITAGCGGGNYCPAQPVTREQMAAFLTTTFGLTLYGP